MSYFIFNGISSDDLGLIIRRTPFRPTWAEETEAVTIPGRACELRQRTGIYANSEISIDCVVSDTSKLGMIYSVLRGSGRLILSTDPDKYMTAICTLPIPQGVTLTMAEMPVSFECLPFAYATNEEPVTVQSSDIITNSGTVYAEPVITFRVNSGNNTIALTIGDITLKLDSMTMIGAGNENVVTIDCSRKLIYYTNSSGIKYNIIDQLNGVFPTLAPGENKISFADAEIYDVNILINTRWY